MQTVAAVSFEQLVLKFVWENAFFVNGLFPDNTLYSADSSRLVTKRKPEIGYRAELMDF